MFLDEIYIFSAKTLATLLKPLLVSFKISHASVDRREVEPPRHPRPEKPCTRRRSSMYLTFTRILWKPLSLLLAVSGLFLAYLLLKPVPPAQVTFGDDLLQSASEVVG